VNNFLNSNKDDKNGEDERPKSELLMKFIRERRTIHNFKSDKVPPKVLQEAIRAGILAPNHKKTWPWKFFIIGEETRALLLDLQINNKKEKTLLETGKEVSDAIIQGMRAKFNEAGALIVLAISKSEDQVQFLEDYAAMACAVQNMSLYLHAEGYGSKWGTSGLIRMQETYRILGISNEEFELNGLFWVGIPKVIPEMLERPPVDNFIVYKK
jgi:nitroreductase